MKNQNILLPAISGIYLVRNTITQKVYVGATQNIRIRVLDHLSKLRQGKHHSKLLQFAYNEYGESSFQFEVLEECSNLIEREQFWCEYYKANNKDYGYNVRIFVHTNTGNIIVFTEETRKKLSQAKLGKPANNASTLVNYIRRPVHLYINGVYESTYISQLEASIKTGIKKCNINNQLRGACKTLRGFENYKFIYADGKNVRSPKKK